MPVTKNREMSVIVVGADDGPHSIAAFKRALKMVDKERTTYHLVTVRSREAVYQLDEVYNLAFGGHLEEREALERQRTQAILERFRDVAKAAGVHFTVVELQGDAREELCLYCSRVKAETLVLGCRGSGFLQRLILGSVSSYCTHNAPCAVLLDHCPDEEAEDAMTEQAA